MTIDYAAICGLPHDSIEHGIGQIIHDGDPLPIQRACENCEEIRQDFEAWLSSHGYGVAA